MRQLAEIFKMAFQNSLIVLLILALIQPFGIDTVKDGRISFILAETFLAFISIIASTIASNAIMRSNIERENLKRSLLHLFIFWLICCPLMASLLLTFVSWFNTGNAFLYWTADDKGSLNLEGLRVMSVNVMSISAVMNIILFYQIRNNKLLNRLSEAEKINSLLEERQAQLSDEEGENMQTHKNNDAAPSTTYETETYIEFTGQGQNSQLKLLPSNIIYVESMANYADICHIANNKIHHTTLRITLKQIKETLCHFSDIVQCHRAFLVNINFIVKMTDRNSGYQLQLFGIEKQIPISRNNTPVIKQKLKAPPKINGTRCCMISQD